jgi:hypothetical protein
VQDAKRAGLAELLAKQMGIPLEEDDDEDEDDDDFSGGWWNVLRRWLE